MPIYRTEDKLKSDTTKTKHNPEKANKTKYSNKTKLAWFSRLLRQNMNLLHYFISWPFTRCSFSLESHKPVLSVVHIKLLPSSTRETDVDILCYLFCCFLFASWNKRHTMINSFTVFKVFPSVNWSSSDDIRLSVCLYCNACVKAKGEHSEHMLWSAVRQLSIICYETYITVIILSQQLLTSHEF